MSKKQTKQAKIEKIVNRTLNKKNAKGGLPQNHPQMSYANMVQKHMEPYINMQIQRLGNALASRINNSMTPVFVRLKAMEDILIERLGETPDSIAHRVMAIEDAASGLVEVTEGGIETGDYVRATIKAKDAGEGSATSEETWAFANIGVAPFQVNEALEIAMIGMATGEAKEVELDFPGRKVTFSVKVDRISRRKSTENVESKE